MDSINQATWIYSKCRTYEELASKGALNRLNLDQKIIVSDYVHKYQNSPLFTARAQTVVEFLQSPEYFAPNEFSYRSAYMEFVLRRYDDNTLPDGRYVIFPVDLKKEDIDWNRLKDVSVSLDYRYSSTLESMTTVLDIKCYSRKNESSEWEHHVSGGVCFSLDNFIERMR